MIRDYFKLKRRQFTNFCGGYLWFWGGFISMSIKKVSNKFEHFKVNAKSIKT